MKNIIPVSELKTHCLQIMQQVYDKHKTVTISKRGKLIAKIMPLEKLEKQESLLGALAEEASINDDIIAPIDEKWNAEK